MFRIFALGFHHSEEPSRYLQERLKLGFNGPEPPILYLHDIENTLSNLVAAIFWIGSGAYTLILQIEC
jgi:hypothetical protein